MYTATIIITLLIRSEITIVQVTAGHLDDGPKWIREIMFVLEVDAGIPIVI